MALGSSASPEGDDEAKAANGTDVAEDGPQRREEAEDDGEGRCPPPEPEPEKKRSRPSLKEKLGMKRWLLLKTQIGDSTKDFATLATGHDGDEKELSESARKRNKFGRLRCGAPNFIWSAAPRSSQIHADGEEASEGTFRRDGTKGHAHLMREGVTAATAGGGGAAAEDAQHLCGTW